jgi:hypothetical protein
VLRDQLETGLKNRSLDAGKRLLRMPMSEGSYAQSVRCGPLPLDQVTR